MGRERNGFSGIRFRGFWRVFEVKKSWRSSERSGFDYFEFRASLGHFRKHLATGEVWESDNFSALC